MDLVEFQGKQLFARHDVPVPPPGVIARSVSEVGDAARSMFDSGVSAIVLKAQVKVGGRGKAGGVKVVRTVEEARHAADTMLGLDIKGHVVRVLYLEAASEIVEEYYLSVLHDRVNKCDLIICSRQGGVDIEEVNRTDPGAVVKRQVLPSERVDGLPRSIAAEVVAEADLPVEVRGAAADLLVSLFGAYLAEDATLAEINPLIRTPDDRVVALDAKVSLDDNAGFRHGEHAEWRIGGIDGDDPLEVLARDQGIQYVKLEGDVGVLGNGAGLVMATLDVVAQHGGRAANFLDVGGGASAASMAASLRLVLSDPSVRSVLINIFGGITRGEDVARGVLGAIEQIGDFPQRLIIRLDGTNAEEGRRILMDAGHPNIIPAPTMEEAAALAVASARSAA